jgi:hypothetical protein
MTENEFYRRMIKVVAGGMLLASACSSEVVLAAEAPATVTDANPDLWGRISE